VPGDAQEAKTNILAVDDDPINRKIVSEIMAHAGYQVTSASSAEEALSILRRTPIDLIILDVIMQGMDGYEMCRRLRSDPNTANIPVILLTSLESIDDKLKGFNAGADDFLSKPPQPDELVARVGVWLRRSKREKEVKEVGAVGKVIAVHSLRGGVGVSTISTNLAIGLAQLWGLQTVLVDLVLSAGQAALMFNLPARNTWGDIARIPTSEIDPDLVEVLLRAHSSGANVLPAPNEVIEGQMIDAAKVSCVLEIIRSNYGYIVLDLPHDFSETTLVGLDMADSILEVLVPEMASVHATTSALDVFSKLQYPEERLKLVLNWVFERQGLSRVDIEAAIQHKISMVIPYSSESFVRAINFGAPPVYEQPNSPLGAFFEDLAFMLSKETHKKNAPKEPTPSWLRIAKRMRKRQNH
jgi:pilus assembly protein CpaE